MWWCNHIFDIHLNLSSGIDGSVDWWVLILLIVVSPSPTISQCCCLSIYTVSTQCIHSFFYISLLTAVALEDKLITMFATQCHFFEEFSLERRQITSKNVKLPWKHQIIQQTLISSYRQGSGSEHWTKWLGEMDIFAYLVFPIICSGLCSPSVCFSAIRVCGGRMVHPFVLIIAITCCNKWNIFCAAQK